MANAIPVHKTPALNPEPVIMTEAEREEFLKILPKDLHAEATAAIAKGHKVSAVVTVRGDKQVVSGLRVDLGSE